MPREIPPEGKWVTVPVRLRESLLGQIDGVRGEHNRSEWMRMAAEFTLGLRKPNGELRPPGATAASLEARTADPFEEHGFGRNAAPEPARKPRRRAAASKTVTPAAEGVPAAAFQEPAQDAPAKPSWMSSLPTYDEVHGRG